MSTNQDKNEMKRSFERSHSNTESSLKATDPVVPGKNFTLPSTVFETKTQTDVNNHSQTELKNEDENKTRSFRLPWQKKRK